MKIQEMNILHHLLALLNPKSSCTPKIANIIAEVAKNGETDPVGCVTLKELVISTSAFTLAGMLASYMLARGPY